MTCCHVSFVVNTNKLLKKLNPDFVIILYELNRDITVEYWNFITNQLSKLVNSIKIDLFAG